MNTKLLASIAVFVLLTAVVSIPMVNSAFAAEPKKDDAKAKADKKAADAKAKADKKAADAKAKADKKAAKDSGTDKATGKTAASGTSTSEVSVDIPKGAAMPACADTKSCYIPDEVTVSIGTTVTWTNTDSAGHFVTSGKDATSDGKFDSGMIMAGGKFSQKFDTAGEYHYFCLVHPWMTGEVNVK